MAFKTATTKPEFVIAHRELYVYGRGAQLLLPLRPRVHTTSSPLSDIVVNQLGEGDIQHLNRTDSRPSDSCCRRSLIDYIVYVCVCENKTRVYANRHLLIYDIKLLVSMQSKTSKLLLSTTYKSMYQYIVKRSVRSKTTHNLRHVYASTSKHAIIDTIVSTKSTDYTL